MERPPPAAWYPGPQSRFKTPLDLLGAAAKGRVVYSGQVVDGGGITIIGGDAAGSGAGGNITLRSGNNTL